MAIIGLRTWRVRLVALGAPALLLIGCGGGGSTVIVNLEPPPTPAAQVGFLIHSFSATFTAETVDTAATQRRGFQWYNWNLYGSSSNLSAVVLNSDRSVTLNGQTGGADGQLVSAVQDSAGDPFVGNSFGGGAYIEAVLKWQPLPTSSTTPSAWPAFWALPLEGNFAPYSDQWPGQPADYVHSTEMDFFEALSGDAGTDSYGGSMHDWYGIFDETCPPFYCQATLPYQDGQRSVPAGTDFTQYHRYGFLWVPATALADGYAQFYFDGVQIGYTYEWQMLTDQPPPPTNQPWAFGIIDQRHLFIILGTGPSQPMTVQSVDVWQAGTSANLVNN
jgi:hypothetical protein